MQKKLSKGQLLIADPSIINDTSFKRSVVLLADHNTEGSVGFILNKPLQYSLNDLVPEIDADFTIYNGGPVEQDNLYFIHTIPNLIPNSIEISQGIFWGGSFELTSNLINSKQIFKNNIRFFLGYSGWEAFQLEQELKSNSWIVNKNNLEKEIIGTQSINLWRNQIKEIGGDYLIWSNSPENPYLN